MSPSVSSSAFPLGLWPQPLPFRRRSSFHLGRVLDGGRGHRMCRAQYSHPLANGYGVRQMITPTGLSFLICKLGRRPNLPGLFGIKLYPQFLRICSTESYRETHPWSNGCGKCYIRYISPVKSWGVRFCNTGTPFSSVNLCWLMLNQQVQKDWVPSPSPYSYHARIPSPFIPWRGVQREGAGHGACRKPHPL